MMERRSFMASGLAAGLAGVMAPWRVRAAEPMLKLGVISDLSGPYRDQNGMTAVECARLAVQDFGQHGFSVEVLIADHRNKPDVAAQLAREWFDRDGVDAIVDVPGSPTALAVNTVAREKNKVFLSCSSGTTDMTGAQCSPNTVHWSWDTYMLAKTVAGAVTRAGKKTWYILAGNYTAGIQLGKDAAGFVNASGGAVIGTAAYPFPETTDFASFLVQAQSSGAQVLGLAGAGADTINVIKQAAEFGVTPGMTLAALVVSISDIEAVGLDLSGGLLLTESFYWDLNDRTRAFAARLRPRTAGVMPSMGQANCYSSTLHYLKTVADMGVAAAKADGKAAIARMKSMPTDDDAYGHCTIRADGRVMFPAYLFQVKSPAQSSGKWDYYNLISTTRAEDAFRSIADSGCRLAL